MKDLFLTTFIIASGAAANPLSGLQFIVDLVIAAVQVAGIILTAKGCLDFFPSIGSHDASGAIHGAAALAGGLAMFFIRVICAKMGISLTLTL